MATAQPEELHDGVVELVALAWRCWSPIAAVALVGGRGAVVADLVVAELVLAVVAVVVREAAVPSSPRW